MSIKSILKYILYDGVKLLQNNMSCSFQKMYFGMHFFIEIEIPNIKALKISLFQLKQLHNIIVSDLFLHLVVFQKLHISVN